MYVYKQHLGSFNFSGVLKIAIAQIGRERIGEGVERERRKRMKWEGNVKNSSLTVLTIIRMNQQ